jgi:hypothetical protein
MYTQYLERAEGEGLLLVEPGFSSWESPCSRRVEEYYFKPHFFFTDSDTFSG